MTTPSDERGATDEQVAEAVRRAQHEILAHMAEGTVPRSVTTFSELHDHVDANTYGGVCDEPNPFELGDVILIQNAVDAWLRTLRTYEVKVLLVTSSERDEAAVTDAVENLAEVMYVQAEDGVYTWGNPDSYGDGERENEHIASVEWSSVTATHITHEEDA